MKNILAPLILLVLSVATYAQQARVINYKANLYPTPSVSGKVKAVLNRNTVVKVVRKKGPWYLVRGAGRSGWLHGQAIKLIHVRAMKPELPMMKMERIAELAPDDMDTGARIVPSGSETVVGDDRIHRLDTRSVPKQVSGGVLNGKAMSLPKPAYPMAARAVHAGGSVSVQVLIDESGRVISANAVSGHPLLRASAVAAAREARFSPTLLMGQPVKVSGVITYNFVP